MTVVITNAEVGGVPGCTVTIDDVQVTVIPPEARGPAHPQGTTAPVHIDAGGAAVVPGLWDHHVHVRSLAARARSVDLSSGQDRAAYAALLTAAEPDDSGWIRAVAYDDDHVGVLNGDDLDELDGRGIPTRVQHRSGHQWLLNRAGRARVGSTNPANTVSKTGVVWGDLTFTPHPDAHAANAHQLRTVATQFNAHGVTGITDMTHTNTSASALELQHELGPTLTVTAYGNGREPGLAGVKLIADDHALPDPDTLVQRVQRARPLPVAIHSVTAETLAVVSWVLGAAGDPGDPGDRIEHAFLASAELREVIATVGVSVGAHPGFVRTHGDRVAQHSTPAELASYQAFGEWQRLGVPLLGGTDAPYSVVNPWVAMQAAVDRTTAAGRVLNPDSALTPEAAFALFTKTGLRTRNGFVSVPVPSVSTGDAPFVALLDQPWGAARTHLAGVRVRGVVTNGRFSAAAG